MWVLVVPKSTAMMSWRAEAAYGCQWGMMSPVALPAAVSIVATA